MAFPEYATSVTFDFTVNMLDDWITPSNVAGPLWSSGGQATSFTGGSDGESAYNTTALTGALKECLAIHSTKGANGTWMNIGLYKPTNITTAKDGYTVFFNNFDKRTGIADWAAGVVTPHDGTDLAWVPVEGDSYGISYDGTTVRGYVKHGGVWSEFVSYTPASPLSGDMYGAIYSPYPSSGGGGGQAWDDFSIGSGAIPSSGLSHLLSGKFHGLLGGKLS